MSATYQTGDFQACHTGDPCPWWGIYPPHQPNDYWTIPTTIITTPAVYTAPPDDKEATIAALKEEIQRLHILIEKLAKK